MVISAIVAMAKNGVIGKGGGLPWYLPAELSRFKEVTMGHPIIMGRKTHESIGRALPGRTNIVITRDRGYKAAEGCVIVGSLNEALEQAKKSEGADEIFIIGGASIYEQAMPLLDRIYLTKVDADIKGDKSFNYGPDEWKQVSSEKHSADEKNQFDFEFTILSRL
ncbi:MAG TPA: dihydrofolate reductase [Candidatus Saccharimonadales bacterium]|nr:dihydrofolate reductase [Candidatus Saccharimonadales bacterium]